MLLQRQLLFRVGLPLKELCQFTEFSEKRQEQIAGQVKGRPFALCGKDSNRGLQAGQRIDKATVHLCVARLACRSEHAAFGGIKLQRRLTFVFGDSGFGGVVCILSGLTLCMLNASVGMRSVRGCAVKRERKATVHVII